LVAGDGCSATCAAEPVALALGGDSSCALGFNGAVKCWGDNSFGQLGLGDTAARGDGSKPLGAMLDAVSLGTGRSVTQLSATENVACALLDNGDAKCWGLNDVGQLGTGDETNRGDLAGEMGDNLKPIAFSSGQIVSSISAGGDHTCVAFSDGSATCWGAARILGLGNVLDQYSPLNLPSIFLGQGRTVRAISSGEYFNTCAVLDDGTGKCWGLGDAGELAVNSSADLNPIGSHLLIGDYAGEMAALAPLSIGSGRTVKALAGALQFTCALLDDATVKCWGASPDGECGQESNTPVGTTPGSLAVLPPIKLGTGRTAKAISLGGNHACALLDDGSVKCWGANEFGQLGVGSTDSKGDQAGEMGDALIAVPLKRPALQVAAGTRHSCALLDDGTVECWGLNESGQLGRGDVLNRGDSGGLAGVDLKPVDLVF
jgi:alpha-tubulin suppressor-like RCC1 family protein